MKYQKPIFLNDSHLAMVRAGKMEIQRGQWVKLEWLDTISRWVGVTRSKSVWAVHCYKINGVNVMDGGNRRFTTMCKSFSKFSN